MELKLKGGKINMIKEVEYLKASKESEGFDLDKMAKNFGDKPFNKAEKFLNGKKVKIDSKKFCD